MLDQLKGARIELKFGNDGHGRRDRERPRWSPASDKQPEREQLTLMLDSGELRTVDLSAATGHPLQRSAAAAAVSSDYLAALAAARSKDKRSVYIDSTDAGEREVAASYMIPAAVWKSSYRLIFGAAGQPMLEGWAIVDNTTGEDWKKVQLVAGLGAADFVRQPALPAEYVQRPTAELPDDNAARPVVHEGGFAMAARGGRCAGDRLRRRPPAPAGAAAANVQNDGCSSAGRGGGAQHHRLGRFRAANWASCSSTASPSRSPSARTNRPCCPSCSSRSTARKLLIYSDHSSQHPTNAAELTNTSGKTLDGGPITVYDGGAYGGEALMETLKAGDKRLISYAVDLGTRITEAFGSKAAVVREIHAKPRHPHHQDSRGRDPHLHH